MKCDHLQAETVVPQGTTVSLQFYPKAETDAAIEELKARIADLEKLNHDLCERVTENDDIRLHWEEIEQTRAENESLKAKLEDVETSAYADSVDAGMRERRMRRALFKACANWAWAEHVRYVDISDGSQGYKKAIERWEKMASKCIKKVGEFK